MSVTLFRNNIFKNLVFLESNFMICKRGVRVKFNVRPELITFCENVFSLPTYRVQSMLLHNPSLQIVKEDEITEVLQTLERFGITKEQVLEHPKVLKVHPTTIDNRLRILHECGFTKINLFTLSKYVFMTRKQSIHELRQMGLLSRDDEIWERLLDCFAAWPDIQKKLPRLKPVSPDENLCDLRMEMLQRFLEINLKMPEVKFQEILKSYWLIKHRSLTNISESLHIVKNVIKLPEEKILTHGFMFQLEARNLEMLLQEVKELGGVDIKVALNKHPTLLRHNYKYVMQIKQIFEEEEIPLAVQSKCLNIFSFSPETIKLRLKELKTSYKVKGLKDNPRVLSLVYSKSKAFKRLDQLQTINKKCSSLHKLTANANEFERFSKQFGDKTKGVDISTVLKKLCSETGYPFGEVKNGLLKHQFWTHTSLVSIISVMDYLQLKFDPRDVLLNCQILLYPLSDVQKHTEQFLKVCNHKKMSIKNNIDKDPSQNKDPYQLGVDLDVLTDPQIMSLVLYTLEKEHHFSGDGIWNKLHPDQRAPTVTQ